MLELLKTNPRFLVGAIIVHVFFLVLFGVGFHFKSTERAAVAQPKTVEVNTIDEKLVKKELAKLKRQEQQEEKRKQALIKKRKAEEKRLAELRNKRKAEQKKEKQRLALAKKKELELKKKQQALEKKQKQEQERLKQLEKQRLEEEERQDRARREKELKEKMLAEETRLKQEQAAAIARQAELKKRQTMIDKYMSLIEAKVYQHWVKPPNVSKGLVCELDVRLIPSGEVINIVLSKSSGDSVYDKSVLSAVKRASPLPLPPAETGLFDVFRDLHLPMRADKKT